MNSILNSQVLLGGVAVIAGSSITIPTIRKGFGILEKFIEHKTGTTKYNRCIDAFEKTVESAVVAVNNSFADNRRQDGTFDTAAQAEAFETAKQKVLSSLASDAKAVLSTSFNLDAYIPDRIDFYVAKAKKSTTNTLAAPGADTTAQDNAKQAEPATQPEVPAATGGKPPEDIAG